MYWYMLISVLAAWRLTHLLQAEDGPFDIIYHIRKRAGTGFFGSLLDCFYCVSIWVAVPFAIWLGNRWWEMVLYWLAISGAVCLLEQFTGNRKSNMPDYKED
ncbi:MAG: DUF1360 domain-containing protein [Agriterribacter sp.]